MNLIGNLYYQKKTTLLQTHDAKEFVNKTFKGFCKVKKKKDAVALHQQQ